MNLTKFSYSSILILIAVVFISCKKNDIQLRFVVISDIHAGAYRSHENLPRTLKCLLQKEPLPDAVFVVGDLTNNGWPQEYDELLETFSDSSIVPKDVAVYFMTGNHEFRDIIRNSETYPDMTVCDSTFGHDVRIESVTPIKRYKEKIRQPLNQYIEIKGYPFITISMTDGDNLHGTMPDQEVRNNLYNDEALKFLSEKMQDASQNYPEKPIFLFSHLGSSCTCFGTFPQDGGGQNQFSSILDNYPQTVFFNGHSHFPIGDPRTIHQAKYTSINSGSASFPSGEIYYIPNPLIPQNHYPEVTEGLIVNILSDGNVEVERWDTFRDEEIFPRWHLKPPFNSSQFLYAERDGLPGPFFKDDAQVTCFIQGNNLIIRFPKAIDNEVVNHYTIDFLNEDGDIFYSGDKFSDFYLNSQMPGVYAIQIPIGKKAFFKLPICNKIKIQVTAVDSYSNKSKPITSEPVAIPSVFLRESL